MAMLFKEDLFCLWPIHAFADAARVFHRPTSYDTSHTFVQMLAAALRRLDDAQVLGGILFAIETGHGARRYEVMTAEHAWELITAHNTSHVYEVICGPCNLYLDIEWLEQERPPAEEEERRVQKVVEVTKAKLLDVFGISSCRVSKATASGMSKNMYKCSWHVHFSCKTFCWATPAAAGQFVRLHLAEFEFVDKIPYSIQGQNWRCVGSSKFSEPHRPLVPANWNTFQACLVQEPVNGRQIIYPDATMARSVSFRVPEHVLPLLRTLDAWAIPQMINDCLCVLPFREKQHCVHVGRKHRSNHQYAVVDTALLLWKMKCHACPDAASSWQPFANMNLLQEAVAQQHSMQALCIKRPTVPAVLTQQNDGCLVLPDLRALGPPPPGDAEFVVCKDGVYNRVH